ncbi:IS110 family transposase [candidate division WOR-3 bacterium]|nr:IS110 family transposase [candidate division WOR-3 bacterium]
MLYFGCDLHKKWTTFTVMDERGSILSQQNIPNTPYAIEQYVNGFSGEKTATVEATFSWFWFVDLMEDLTQKTILAHPGKAKDILKGRAKTDKLDSKGLADLTRVDLIPEVYIPPKEIRDIRELLRYRTGLVRLRTSLKNKTHSILHKNGILHSFSDLFSERGKQWLGELPLRSCYQYILKTYIDLIQTFNTLVTEAEQEIYTKPLKQDEEITLLRDLPGIGELFAFHIKYEIVTIERFYSDKNLVSYAGLAPATKQSADNIRYGKLIPQSNHWLKWALIEAAQHARRHYWFRPTYKRVLLRHGKNIAKIAVARKLARVIYFMLSRKEPFRGRE